MKNDDVRTKDAGDERLGRDGLLRLLDSAALEAARKIESGRVRSAENERVRCQWITSLAAIANASRKIEKDRDELEELEVMRERLERLERVANDRQPAAPVGAGADS